MGNLSIFLPQMVSSLMEFILSYDKHLVNTSSFLFSGYFISSIFILFNYFGGIGGEIFIITLFHHMGFYELCFRHRSSQLLRFLS